MKPTALLLAAGLFFGLCTIPAAASPLLLESTSALTAASVGQSLQYNFGSIEGASAAIQEAADTIFTAIAEAERSVDPPDPDDTASIRKVGAGQLEVANMLQKALDESMTQDAAGKPCFEEIIFYTSLARMLNNKNPELTRFAAKGWETTEKRATAKFAALNKKPTLEGANDAIIAILIGMLQEVEANKYYVDAADGAIRQATQDAIDASDLNVWRSNYGAGGG